MKAPEELGIGMMVRFSDSPETGFRRLREIGLCHCQFAAPPDEYLYGAAGRENTKKLLAAVSEYDVCVTSLFISFPGQDWLKWKNSIGLVPPATRAQRIARACRSADWARELGIVQIASHVGCIPENTDDPEYPGFVEAMRGLCLLLEANGQIMAYETGQESLKTLTRTMNDVGVGNQRINFDPANLLIYDQDDPMELVKTMGELVVHVHCKDACRPVSPNILGTETRLGDGDTDFAGLLKALCSQGYRGPLTIEREIPPGPEQRADIIHAVKLIESIKREFK
ncbi:MAG: sugar phosphate isomerase/epimerase [Victivallaceae bacterium]|nr:sugar phosphate isomerase/epimerase [Victivallaceae bacterium]